MQKIQNGRRSSGTDNLIDVGRRWLKHRTISDLLASHTCTNIFLTDSVHSQALNTLLNGPQEVLKIWPYYNRKCYMAPRLNLERLHNQPTVGNSPHDSKRGHYDCTILRPVTVNTMGSIEALGAVAMTYIGYIVRGLG